MEFLDRTDIRIDLPRIHEKMHNFDAGFKGLTKSLIDKSKDLGITFLTVYIAKSRFFGKAVGAESTFPEVEAACNRLFIYNGVVIKICTALL